MHNMSTTGEGVGQGSGNLPGAALAQTMAAAQLSCPMPGAPEHPGLILCHAPRTICPHPQVLTEPARPRDGHPLGHGNPPALGRTVPGRGT